MVTRAVHLKISAGLSTEDFLAALQKCVTWQGAPTIICSDSGTSFVGAEMELRDLFRTLREDDSQACICQWMSEHGIQWQFSPGTASHFSGMWEAAVKSMKTLLRKVTGNHTPTLKEIITVLTQDEAILNSRPLIPAETLNKDAVDLLMPGSGDPSKAYHPGIT